MSAKKILGLEAVIFVLGYYFGLKGLGLVTFQLYNCLIFIRDY